LLKSGTSIKAIKKSFNIIKKGKQSNCFIYLSFMSSSFSIVIQRDLQISRLQTYIKIFTL